MQKLSRIFLIASLLVPSVSVAAIVVVTDPGDGAGMCPGNSCTLRAAIAAADPGDTISFNLPGPLPATITLGGSELIISQSLLIVGPGADQLAISAANLSRVMTVNGASVGISGISLENGRVLAMAGPGGINGSAGTSGQPADGGCLRVGVAANLVLDHVALRQCRAQGGAGGPGGAGPNANPTGNTGGSGGSGGQGRGGAVSVSGTLTMQHSSITASLAKGGAGGAAGDGGDGFSGGAGGAGGNGGHGLGGAIHVRLAGSLTMVNSSLLDNGAEGGNAGSGGDGGSGAGQDAVGGLGGNGGNAQGGNVFLENAVPVADLEFVTLGPASLTAGFGGPPGNGSPNGMGGLAGSPAGEILLANSASRIHASLLVGNKATPDCGGIAPTASAGSIDSDASCSGLPTTTAAQTYASLTATEALGLSYLQPLTAGAAVDQATVCTDISGATVSTDQIEHSRPDPDSSPQCDLGAIELGARIFGNGFEAP